MNSGPTRIRVNRDQLGTVLSGIRLRVSSRLLSMVICATGILLVTACGPISPAQMVDVFDLWASSPLENDYLIRPGLGPAQQVSETEFEYGRPPQGYLYYGTRRYWSSDGREVASRRIYVNPFEWQGPAEFRQAFNYVNDLRVHPEATLTSFTSLGRDPYLTDWLAGRTGPQDPPDQGSGGQISRGQAFQQQINYDRTVDNSPQPWARGPVSQAGGSVGPEPDPCRRCVASCAECPTCSCLNMPARWCVDADPTRPFWCEPLR